MSFYGSIDPESWISGYVEVRLFGRCDPLDTRLAGCDEARARLALPRPVHVLGCLTRTWRLLSRCVAFFGEKLVFVGLN